MSTSGTVGLTTISVARLITNALRRVGLTPANATNDIWEASRDSLYYFLTSLSNAGLNLWCIDKTVMGMLTAKTAYTLPIGTLDLVQMNYRQISLPSDGIPAASSGVAANAFDADLATACTQVSPNGNISYDFGSPIIVTNVGVNANGANVYNLIYEYSSDGLSWNTLVETEEKAYVDYEWGIFDPVQPVSAQYYRVREAAGATLNLREVMFNTILQEWPAERININDYQSLPQKNQPSRQTIQYWLNRQREAPIANIWPAPNYDFDQLVAIRHRHIQDVGNLTNEIDVPIRWMDALQSGLSFRMVMDVPGADMARHPMLKEAWDSAYYLATAEEVDDSPINLMPNLSAYTR